MCGGLKKRYILTALVCFGAVMSGGGFAQAESTTTESRSETRTTVDRNGTIAERVRRTESRTTVSSETKDSDAIRIWPQNSAGKWNVWDCLIRETGSLMRRWNISMSPAWC